VDKSAGSAAVRGRRKAANAAARRPISASAAALVVALLAVLIALSGCSWVKGIFGGNNPNKPASVSVFTVAIGDCFLAPAEPRAELSELTEVPCTVPHQQEAYAVLTYLPAAGTDPSVYPGNQALETFAKGACASAFTAYVGTAYPDSSLFYTYLLPSPRSWTGTEDRSVICFITTTGATLTASVKGSKL
jgi:hypothetical protein